MTNITVALISFLGTVVGSIGGIMASSKLTTYRIEQLEKKVEKHNCLVERMAVAEQSIKAAHNRIDELER